jgi:hypothetical protein
MRLIRLKDSNTKVTAYGMTKGSGTPSGAMAAFAKAPRMQKGAMAYDGPNKASSEAKDRILAKAPVKKAKKNGVVGISKAENQQLGLILRWISLELDWDTIPNEVLVDPEALTKLYGRYSKIRENG